jgi:hypothetical protein
LVKGRLLIVLNHVVLRINTTALLLFDCIRRLGEFTEAGPRLILMRIRFLPVSLLIALSFEASFLAFERCPEESPEDFLALSAFGTVSDLVRVALLRVSWSLSKSFRDSNFRRGLKLPEVFSPSEPTSLTDLRFLTLDFGGPSVSDSRSDTAA